MKVTPSILMVLACGISTFLGCTSVPKEIANHTATPAEPVEGTRFTLLHTNDHHGRFWHNKHGEYGLAARKTLIDRIRAEVRESGGEVLLLSGGDINTGVPESDLQDAEPDFIGMRDIGYDAMAIGNHEFDNPLSVLRQQEKWAGFPFLSANIYDKTTKERLFPSHHTFDVNGLKIAVLGLTTDDTKKIGNPEYLENIRFRSPIVEAAQLVPELAKKSDVVIAATHMGHYQDGEFGINAPGDVSLARLVPQIDVVVGGHSQDPVCMMAENQADTNYKPGGDCAPDRQNGTWIVQAHEWGKYVGRADFEWRKDGLKLLSYELIPVNLKKKVVNSAGEKVRVFIQDEIVADKSLATLLTPYQEKGQEQLLEVIGKSAEKLEGDRSVIRFHPTNLGHLIATAQMEKVGGDVAVMNSGGIRDSISEGDISYKDVLKVQPFSNTICYVDLTGNELMDYLKATAEKPIDSGAFAQFSGAKLVIEGGQLNFISVDDKPIDSSKTYRLAINSFIASGGDGYPELDTHENFVNTGFVDADVLKEFLQKHSPIEKNAFSPENISRSP